MRENSLQQEMLIFVYNADAGLFSLVSDFAHKIISPGTYACNLCKLTYGNFAIKKEWSRFIEDFKIDKKFLHKDEFYKKYPDFKDRKLPAIWSAQGGKLSEVIGADELNNLNDLDSLKSLLRQRLTF